MTHQTARRRLHRHACLAAIACLHLAAFLAWRATSPAHHALLPQREGALVFIQAPAAAPLPPAPRQRPAGMVRAAAPVAITTPAAGAAISGPSVSASPEAPSAPALPDDPFGPAPSAPAADTLTRARLAAASVDRQLRKESLNKFATLVDPDKADRHSINGPAYRPPPPPESFADGRGIVHKRHMVRGRMVCETVDHVSPRAMQGSIVRQVKCPE